MVLEGKIALAEAMATNFSPDNLPLELGDSEEVETTDREQFHITDDSSADWLLRKYAAINAEISLIQNQAAAAVKRLQSDREGLERLYQAELEEYARQRIAADKRGRKSVILPHGTVAFRTIPAGLKIVDEQEALEWAIREGRCYGEVKVLDKAVFRAIAGDYLNIKGELLPGVEMQPERESFGIRFGGNNEE
jgi:hypothetical protein